MNKQSIKMMNHISKSMLLFILLTLSVLPKAIAQDCGVDNIRVKLEEARTNENTANQVYESFADINPDDALCKAFKASSSGVMCLHIKSPFKRMKYVDEAIEYANSAVDMAPNSLEVRFIRFAIESQLPKILGRSKHVDSDAAFMKKHFNKSHFSAVPYEALEEMIEVMKESDMFSSEEILTMQKELNAYGN